MPENPIPRLRQLFMPTVTDKARRVAEETMRSPMADTLWAISGGGAPTVTANMAAMFVPRLRGGIGAYYPVTDIVAVDPSYLSQLSDEKSMRYTAQNVVSHEAGHRADFKRGLFGSGAPGRNAPFKLPKIDLPDPPRQEKLGKMVQVAPNKWATEKPYDPYARQRDLINVARSKVDEYYQTSPREGYAQAFAAAMGVLRLTPKFIEEGKTRDEYAQELAKVEETMPGTGGIVEALLKEPVFKNHPLQRFYRRSQ